MGHSYQDIPWFPYADAAPQILLLFYVQPTDAAAVAITLYTAGNGTRK